MSANLITLSGFNETVEALKKMGAVVNLKVVTPSMRECGVSFLLAAKANAQAMKNAKRKEGKHLYQSIGKRVKAYSKNGAVFVAIGGMYRQGGFHAHLVELGHRVVVGGTLDTGLKMPGITARGKRWIESNGMKLGWYKKRNSKNQSISSKYRGRLVTKYGMQDESGVWHDAPGMTYKGKQVRGGGKLTKKVVKPHPFLKPAWDSTKRQVLYAIEEGIKTRLVDQCVQAAREAGVKQ